MDTLSKVAHTKYAVAKTCISGVRLITVIHVLKLLFTTTANHVFFCIEFQILKLTLTSYLVSEVDDTVPVYAT